MAVSITHATTLAQFEDVRALCREYAHNLGVDLETQNLSRELAGLPGDYTPPQGRLLLAMVAGEAAGCVALRPLSRAVCEMKRLYVRPSCRNLGIGRALVQRVLDEARAIGYEAMRLDTLADRMQPAVALYRAVGFVAIAPYWNNPLPGAAYMELRL